MSAGENDEKTEAPTDKRLDEAVQRGDVPIASDVRHAAMIGIAFVLVSTGVCGSAGALARIMASLLETGYRTSLTDVSAVQLLQSVVVRTAMVVGPPLGLCVLGALIAAAGQGRIVMATNRIQPQMSRVSLLAGFKRLFGGSAILHFGKTLLKLLAIGMAIWTAASPAMEGLFASSNVGVGGLIGRLSDVAGRMLGAAFIAATALALVDLLLSRIEYLRRMKMTRDEVKLEYKNSEGSSEIKSRIRAIRMQRGRKRMLAAVPKAAVVVMNPTHYAVALAYDHGITPVPTVVAKGMDSLALLIRAAAEQANIPVIVDPPLARAIHAAVEVDQAIPEELFQVVAQVISFVLRGAPRAF